MRKLSLLLVILAALTANVAQAAITGTQVTGFYPGSRPDVAMTVDEEGVAVFQPAVATETPEGDVIVTIFSEHFAVEKTFTLKNVTTGENNYQEGAPYTQLGELYVTSFDMRNDIMVTRNFFVENNKWCILLRTGFNSETSYTVVDETGANLGNLNSITNEYDPSIYLDGICYGTPYLVIDSEDNITGDSMFCLYTFEGTSSIEAVNAVKFSSAYPNPLPRGGELTIELSRISDKGTVLSIMDMNGRQVMRKPVKPGMDSIKVNGRFGHGHYVYSVIYGDGTVDSGRLMAE